MDKITPNPLPSRKTKHVALIIEAMGAPRRLMLTGVAQYIQEHEPWSIYLKPSNVAKSLGDWLQKWDGDGMIASIDAQNAKLVSQLRMPLVDVAGAVRDEKIPLVHANDRSIGKVGAEHLLERGFQHFGFAGYPGAYWSDMRKEGFSETIKARGFDYSYYGIIMLPETGGPAAWETQQKALVEWIKSLPKPCGVMTSTDLMGQQMLEACLRAGVRVPEEVAVLGADNDEPIARICTPPLSSVIINDHQRGYQAAAELDRLMSGGTPRKEPVLVEPSGVMCRASTDIMAIDDPAIVAALRCIRDRASDGINVADVARVVPVSRRVLERRFKKLVGRSVNEEITRMRLNHAIELLTGTELELKTIAMKAGFSSQAYMCAVFRSELSRTPSSYRGPKG